MITLEFPITPPYKADILRQYGRNLSRYPVVKAEVDAFLRGQDETFALCLQYLYGHMAAQDVLSASVSVFASYVQATLEAFRQMRDDGEIFESTMYAGHNYGSCKKDVQQILESGRNARGLGGVKMPRMNMAFTPVNHDFIMTIARMTGQTYTDFVNHVIDLYREEHKEQYEAALKLRNSI